MLSLSDQLDILNSDTKLLDLTKRQGNLLSLPGDIFPDGLPYAADTGGQMSFDILQSWVGQVRREWNARQDRKAAEETKQAAARRTDSAGEVPSSADGRGSPVPVEDNPQVGEASLEETLRTKIAVLDRACEWWEDRVTTSRNVYTHAEQSLTRVKLEREVAMALLRQYKDMMDDSSEDSETDSIILSAVEVEGT